MPRFDGTGPWGLGPLTGRGLGPCGAGMAWRRGWGRGFGWQRRGRFRGGEGGGRGLDGFCVCPKCGYKIEHQRGVPCSTLICPNCKIPLERQLERQ